MLDFAKGDGLVTAIAKDAITEQILMVAHMNRESFEETVRTGYVTYWSRSRKKLWRKGEESGHRQLVCQILIDCDADAVILKVEQQGAACHKGFKSCFFRKLMPDGSLEVIEERVFDPKQVYGKKEGEPHV